MKTQRRQTYASHIDFDSFTVCMCILILNILQGSLQPKLKEPMFGPLMHAISCYRLSLSYMIIVPILRRENWSKVNCSDYLGQFLRAPAGPVFRLDWYLWSRLAPPTNLVNWSKQTKRLFERSLENGWLYGERWLRAHISWWQLNLCMVVG